MKLLLIGLMALSSVSSFAQASSSELFDKIYETETVCNLEELLSDHAFELVKKNPNDIIYKKQLASAQKKSVKCMADASQAVESLGEDCAAAVDSLLDKSLVCTNEESLAEAAFTVYRTRPTTESIRNLGYAQEAFSRCGAKLIAVCSK